MKKIRLITLTSIAGILTLLAIAKDKPLTMAEIKGDSSIKNIDEKAPSLENLRDPAKAMDIAKKDGKILMYHFTGSSWCPPCMYLEKKVMHTKELADYAKNNIAYVNMDFTKGGMAPLDKEFGYDYEELATKYGLTGFPTLILINPKTNKMKTLVGVETKNPAELIKVIKDLKATSK